MFRCFVAISLENDILISWRFIGDRGKKDLLRRKYPERTKVSAIVQELMQPHGNNLHIADLRTFHSKASELLYPRTLTQAHHSWLAWPSGNSRAFNSARLGEKAFWRCWASNRWLFQQTVVLAHKGTSQAASFWQYIYILLSRAGWKSKWWGTAITTTKSTHPPGWGTSFHLHRDVLPPTQPQDGWVDHEASFAI